MRHIAPWVDEAAVEACRAAPERGPRIVFFSGGTALRTLAAHLPRYTHRSTHLITPFDSGGSSAELRRAFALPAVGDCRNRLLALSNGQGTSSGRLRRLLARRLPAQAPAVELRRELARLAARERPTGDPVPGSAPLTGEHAERLAADLDYMQRRLPADFDLRRASLGNLALAGSALRTGNGLPAALKDYERLLRTPGTVRPVSCDAFHLGAELATGEVVLGQHRLTGKETPPPGAPIRRIFLTRSLEQAEPVVAQALPEVLVAIVQADLIVYAMGSFFTSLLAALQPAPLAEAIARARAPKVYVPSAGQDPEMRGLTLAAAVRHLLATLRQHAPAPSPADLLDAVLVDPAAHASLLAPEAPGALVLTASLCSASGSERLAPRRLVPALLSLARSGLPVHQEIS